MKLNWIKVSLRLLVLVFLFCIVMVVNTFMKEEVNVFPFMSTLLYTIISIGGIITIVGFLVSDEVFIETKVINMPNDIELRSYANAVILNRINGEVVAFYTNDKDDINLVSKSGRLISRKYYSLFKKRVIETFEPYPKINYYKIS